MKKGKKKHILVVVSGGVLNEVFASPDIADELTVDLVDFDDLDADGKSSAQRDHIYDQKIKNMKEVY